MENVQFPIRTIREGETTTKVCVEDVYKLVGRLEDSLDNLYLNSRSILNTLQTDNKGLKGYYITGTGKSCPCGGDVFNEVTGSNIAFMKAKLNANLKKYRILERLAKEYTTSLEALLKEAEKVEKLICRDIKGIREFNPDYLADKFEIIEND